MIRYFIIIILLICNLNFFSQIIGLKERESTVTRTTNYSSKVRPNALRLLDCARYGEGRKMNGALVF